MARLKKLSLRALVWAWRASVVVILLLNLRLYSASPLATTRNSTPPTLLHQLAANRAALDDGAAAGMQQLFPEGFYFCHLFHGLTWIELAMRDGAYSDQAIDQAIGCLEQLGSSEGRAPFASALPPSHGMFYSAWKCHLRAGVVALQHGEDSKQLRLLRKECDDISRAIQMSDTPFLASYPNAAWPCDTVPAIHALATLDRIDKNGRYSQLIASWLMDVRDRLDPKTELLPHTASLPDGRQVGMARATSQVIILRLLPDIDAAFAKRQYQTFRKRFLTTLLGAPCVLEYPSGASGPGDIDSGPLILGRSLSATVLLIGVAQVYGDHALANAVAQAGETVGMPWTSDGEKRYWGGLLPIGDIMVAYAHVARPWFSRRSHHPDTPYRLPASWRLGIHVASMLILLPLLWRLRRTSRDAPQRSNEGIEEFGSRELSD